MDTRRRRREAIGTRSARGAVLGVLAMLVSGHAAADLLELGPPFIVTDPALHAPAGLGLDETRGRLLVANTGNHRVLMAEIDAIAAAEMAWVELGYVAARDAPEAVNEPQAVAASSAGHVYVVDTFGGEVELYRYDPVADTYAYDPGFASTTRHVVDGVPILWPRDVAVGADDRVYLLDSGNRRILVADGPDAASWTVWQSDPGWGNPYGLDVDADGVVYLADTDHHRVLRLDESGASEPFGGLGTTQGRLRTPRDVAVDAEGRMFVCDTHNHRVVILRADGSY